MKKIVILPSFERSIKKLSPPEKKQLDKGLKLFNQFLVSGEFPFGFGLKKINHDKYEFRVGIRLRVIVKQEDDTFYLALVGSHDEIRRYLRNFRTL
ncbi:MAG: hypothetical protein Q8O13_03485 [Candidatus Omnitrophota bacterium]|nr:hypothetical protein [Candidatus Omnitrophota bacterium]